MIYTQTNPQVFFKNLLLGSGLFYFNEGLIFCYFLVDIYDFNVGTGYLIKEFLLQTMKRPASP